MAASTCIAPGRSSPPLKTCKPSGIPCSSASAWWPFHRHRSAHRLPAGPQPTGKTQVAGHRVHGALYDPALHRVDGLDPVHAAARAVPAAVPLHRPHLGRLLLFGGLVLVMTLNVFPFMMTILKNAILNIPASLEESGAVFGAGFGLRLRKIFAPAAHRQTMPSQLCSSSSRPCRSTAPPIPLAGASDSMSLLPIFTATPPPRRWTLVRRPACPRCWS